MCGIVGFWSSPSSLELKPTVEAMARKIISRGPDSAGEWVDAKQGLALGHRRLAVIDLSPAGHQPMASPCGRYQMVYNGETYNHLDIRADIDRADEKHKWVGHSDTESLLAEISQRGVPATLERLNGMFALAVWDKKERKLILARDRMGEKPLYYGLNGKTFYFTSELKALLGHPNWQGEIDREALCLYLRHNYVPTPWSIYKGIRKLPPAHYVEVEAFGSKISNPKCFWNLKQHAEANSLKATGSCAEFVDEFESILKDSVRIRMASDVPLGTFLSGGLDSSTVTALMQAQSSSPVRTFSVGFAEREYNEAEFAKAIAKHLGTEHTEFYVSPSDALEIIPRLPEIWDEPFSDSSQIPTFLISKLARQHVTVILSGDGGDELFCGYNRYNQGYEIWNKLRLLPAPARQFAAYLMSSVKPGVLSSIGAVLPRKFGRYLSGDKAQKLADVIRTDDPATFYRLLVSHFSDPSSIVIGAEEPIHPLFAQENRPAFEDFRQSMMFYDQKSYLPDDILTKVDRASMAVGLETRVPLLDHRLVEFAWKLPMDLKVRDGKSKWILRQVLNKHVPNELIDRPKMGFGVPIDSWLRGPLRDWAESLLDEKRLTDEGFFDPQPIRKMWLEHISGERSWHYYLWDILMFQAWLEKFQASE